MNHYIIALDVSLSMTEHIEKMVKGVNGFLEDIYKSESQTHNLLSFVLFNTSTEYLFKARPIGEIQPVKDIGCGSCTSLYDTIGMILRDFQEMTNYNHHLYIITDGDDNMSKTYNKNQIDELCEKAINTNWKITHCHTDISKLNVSNSIVYDINNLDTLFCNLSMQHTNVDTNVDTNINMDKMLI